MTDEDEGFDTFGDDEEPSGAGPKAFGALWGDRLGKNRDAGAEALERQQLSARCANHITTTLKLEATIRHRAKLLTGSDKIRAAPGTIERVNLTLPELPFWFQPVWRPKEREPQILDALGASDASLPCTLYETYRDEHLETRPDPHNRAFCAMFAMPKRQAFLVAFRSDQCPFPTDGFPSISVPRKNVRLMFAHSGALLRHLQKQKGLFA